MSITPTYPGVYVTEVPSGNRTVTGVATSITAFVGTALRGEVDRPVDVANFADFQRAFGPIWRQSGLGYAVRDFYLNGGGPAIVVRVAGDGAVAAEVALGDLVLRALGPGTWANAMTATVTHPDPQDAADVAAAQGLPNGDGLFSLELTLGEEVEFFANVSTTPGPRRVDSVLASSRLVRVLGDVPADRPGAADYAVTTDGAPGATPEAADFTTADPKRGIHALDASDLVNILVIPPLTPAGQVPDAVWKDALAYAGRRRAFLIVDPPPGTGRDDVATWITGGAGLGGPLGNHAAVYYPRILASDPLQGGAVAAFAPSGALAGVFARIDATRGVWKAPAGIEAGITGALGLSVRLTDDDSGALNPRGVNALRTFPGAGTVSWGARTLRGSDRLSDEYKYVPVRRLALYLEESLYRGTQWVVFEPNDEPLWSQIRMSVGAFMQDLFRKGAFQGASPKDAYFVRCSSETTTQYDIDRGVVNIEVGFAPLKPAEFVMISIQQKSSAPQA